MSDTLAFILLFATPFLGGLLGVWIKFKPSGQGFKLFLSFSGAYLLAICALHLLPEVYQTSSKNVGVWLLGGFIFQLILEFFSQGIEHGHAHGSAKKGGALPWGILISLSVHAFIEGIPVQHHVHHEGHVHLHELELNSALLFGILVHKLPVALVLCTLLLNYTHSKLRVLILLGVFCLMAPLGMWLGETIQQQHWHLPASLIPSISAFVVGMFFHISTTILFESSESHQFNIYKLGSAIAGGVLGFLTF